MLSELLASYEDKFNEELILPLFWNLPNKEQVKILKECLEENTRIYENKYFNENYIEEVE